MTSNITLQVTNLSFGYRHYWTLARKPILSDIDLEVKEGEIFGFLGHNGAGKTTFIKCILGLLTPLSGSCKIHGLPATDPQSRIKVGYVPEQPYFYPQLTVLEMMKLYATLAGVPSSKLTEAINSVLNEVRIDYKRDAQIKSLSKGQLQRVAMAQALVGEAPFLVLDEPFSGLDPIGRKEFSDILHDRKSRGYTILICSHILSDIEALCDRVSIMKNGRLIKVFSMDDLPASASTSVLTIKESAQDTTSLIALADSHTSNGRLTRLHFSSPQTAQEGLEKALASGLHVEAFTSQKPDLETIFCEVLKENSTKEGACN